jgi:DNA-binding phage protein
MTLKTHPFSAAEYLDTPEAVAAYIDEALKASVEDQDPGLIAAALGEVAKA